HRLLRWLVATLAAAPARRTAPVAAALVLAMAGVSAAHDTRRVVGVKVAGGVLWTTPALTANLGRSVRMYQRIQRGIEHSPYTTYDDDYRLVRKPDVHLYLVESYGRIMFSHPELAPTWRERLQRHEARLREAGWHVV